MQELELLELVVGGRAAVRSADPALAALDVAARRPGGDALVAAEPLGTLGMGITIQA